MSSSLRVHDADPSPPTARSWRPTILRLHFYAGIVVAPFILIATITGGLYAVAPTVEQFVYRDYLQVDDTGPALPVSQQIEAARQTRPDLALSAVRPAEPGETTRVLFADPSLAESERWAVFVDPSTATAVGELAVYGSSGALPMRTWIDQLHRNLHLGEPGRLYSEFAASWLWVIALGGLYLWIDRYRRRRARGNARLIGVDPTSRGRRRTLEWHGVVGIWIAVGLVFLSATGLTWSTYAGANVTSLRSSLSWTTPAVASSLDGSVSPSGEHSGHGAGGHSAGTADASGIDRALSVAREQGIDGPVEVTIPTDSTTAFVVAETRQPWVMSNNSIAVDGATGAVVDTVWFADWPWAAKLSAWGIQLHMGLLFGLANQLALVALAVALTTVIVRGYLMWWRRRPATASTMGRPPVRGGLRRLSPISLTAAAVAAALVGWFVPLLGLGLVLFFVVDIVVAQSLRRKQSS